MKANPHFQNNLIVSIVVGVLALIGIGVVYANKPEPAPLPDPEQVPAVNVALPAGGVVRSKGLPKNENQNQAGGPAAGGAAPAGPSRAGQSGGSPLPGGGGGGGAPRVPTRAGSQ